MKSNYLALGTLTLLSTLVAASDNSTTGRPHLHVSGGRSDQQRRSPSGQKLDAALAELTSHVSAASTPTTLADLHALNPAAKFMQRAADSTPLVSVDAVTRGDPEQLKRALVQLEIGRAHV